MSVDAAVLSEITAAGSKPAAVNASSYDATSYFGRKYIGIYDNMEEAAFLQRKMIENSDRLIIVADASKFGRRAPSRIVPAEKLSLVVTNFVSDNYQVVQQMIAKGVRFEFVRPDPL